MILELIVNLFNANVLNVMRLMNRTQLLEASTLPTHFTFVLILKNLRPILTLFWFVYYFVENGVISTLWAIYIKIAIFRLTYKEECMQLIYSFLVVCLPRFNFPWLYIESMTNYGMFTSINLTYMYIIF